MKARVRKPRLARIAIKRRGALHKQLGIPEGEKIPVERLQRLKRSRSARTRTRAVFALNARKWYRGGTSRRNPLEKLERAYGERR